MGKQFSWRKQNLCGFCVINAIQWADGSTSVEVGTHPGFISGMFWACGLSPSVAVDPGEGSMHREFWVPGHSLVGLAWDPAPRDREAGLSWGSHGLEGWSAEALCPSSRPGLHLQGRAFDPVPAVGSGSEAASPGGHSSSPVAPAPWDATPVVWRGSPAWSLTQVGPFQRHWALHLQ